MAYDSTNTGAEVDAAIAKVAARSGDLIDGSGNTNKVAKFSGANTITDSIITDSGSAVTVAGALDVTGASTFSSLDINGGSIDGTTVGASSASTGAFTTLSASGDVNFDSNTLFVDASTNNVGIGSSVPDKLLVVAGAGSEIVIDDTDATDTPRLRFRESGATSGSVSTDAGELIFDSGTTERMRIDSSGNVGINTNNPAELLHVKSSNSDTAETVAGFGNGDIDVGLEIKTNGNGGSSLDWGFNAKNARNLVFDTNQNERMRITSTGNVGIGDDTPSYKLDVNGTSRFVSTAQFDANTANYGGAYDIYRSGAGYFRHRIADQTLSLGVTNTAGTVHYPIVMAAASDVLIFNNEDGEMARFDTSGNLGIGENSPDVLLHVGTGSIYQNKTGSGVFPGLSDTTSHGCMIESQGANGSTIHISRTDNAAGNFSRQGTGDVVIFRNTSGSVTEAGSVEITGASSVAYRTSSDYRLKENVVDVADGIDRVKQLNPVRFNFIGEDPVLDGFLAHEVQDIVPEAISGTKDGMKDEEYEVSPAVYENVVHPAVEATYDEDGQEITPAQDEWTERVLVSEAVMGTRTVPAYQGIDQSKLVPLLTAALQEAVTKIEALETRVAALEG
jgi:hypothetical protein